MVAAGVLAAYSAVNQGHCHPKILAAMVEQATAATGALGAEAMGEHVADEPTVPTCS